MNTPHRTLSRCLVCGFAEVRTDEVIDHGVVLLSECPRCCHRRTQQVDALPSTPRRARRAPAEGVHAA